ncbi:MAG: hypothetical protein HEQ40_00620 [Lacibacter sp.]|jgi:hypothetical protein
MGTFKTERRIKFDYIRSIITGLAIPIGCLLLWYFFYPSTLNEFLLLTHNTKVAPGQITKAEEIEDYVETNNDRKIERTLDFNFEYTFRLPDGKSVTSFGSEVGALPEELANVKDKPFAVEVEYLTDNPETNRVKAAWTGEKSLFQWFRHKFIIGFLIFLFCCWWGFRVLKDGKKNYTMEIKEYNKILQEYRAKQK